MVREKLKRIIFYFLPPYEAYMANNFIKKEENIISNQNEAKNISETFFKKATTITCSDSFLSQISILENSEIRRRETIESKAMSLLGALGVTITILSFIITIVIEENWRLTFLLSDISIYPTLILWFFILAIFHLIISVLYSLKVIIIEKINVISPDRIIEILTRFSRNYNEKLLSEKLKNTKLNEPKIHIKINMLYVSQIFFKRGIIFIGIGTVIFLLYKLTI